MKTKTAPSDSHLKWGRRNGQWCGGGSRLKTPIPTCVWSDSRGRGLGQNTPFVPLHLAIELRERREWRITPPPTRIWSEWGRGVERRKLVNLIKDKYCFERSLNSDQKAIRYKPTTYIVPAGSILVDYKQIQKLKISLNDLWGSFRDFDKFINLLSSVIAICHLLTVWQFERWAYLMVSPMTGPFFLMPHHCRWGGVHGDTKKIIWGLWAMDCVLSWPCSACPWVQYQAQKPIKRKADTCTELCHLPFLGACRSWNSEWTSERHDFGNPCPKW